MAAGGWGLALAVEGVPPVVHDDRFEIELVAEDPEIVTPTGMAIDGRDRVYVVESHTHHPPAGYDGPDGDRIKVFAPSPEGGGGGTARVFAEGLNQVMNIAFSPGGDLYAVCAREVLRLPDRDGDGICDGPERVLELETRERYAHNSLMGIAFDAGGWMYVSRGNVGSHAYGFAGAGGVGSSGYGDGGNVVRCRPDGSALEEFATGFWNPFDLDFDCDGRLLLVDNDPDARGPNRLVHVVRGGDYGYKSLYGGSGNHPFQGWDGSLPGTLPVVSGVGEAPCDVIDCRRTSFPASYSNSVLVTVWGENTIERVRLEPSGVSVRGERSVFVSGGQDFRPVALAADSRGDLYVTDWVLVAYPNHGRGRVWKVRARERAAGWEAPPAFTAAEAPPAAPAGGAGLASADPFVRHAAVLALAGSGDGDAIAAAARSADARARSGAALAAARSGDPAWRQFLPELLADGDAGVRRAALLWAGESFDPGLRPLLDRALGGAEEAVTPVVFDAYLAAVKNLDPEFVEALRRRGESRANQLTQKLDPELPVAIAGDEARPPAVRAMAIGKFDPATAERERGWLARQLRGAAPAVQVAAARALGTAAGGGGAAVLAAAAADASAPPELRCESLVALAGSLEPALARTLTPLLDDAHPEVAEEAARVLRPLVHRAPEVMAAMRDKLDRARPGGGGSGELVELLGFAVAPFDPSVNRFAAHRPASPEAWEDTLATGGDPERGRRIFANPAMLCSGCHTADGRGGVLGPDLSGLGQSVDRRQITRSILLPSEQFPPQYQAWVVHTVDGQAHAGLQLDHKAKGAIELLATTGETVRFEASDIDRYEASPASLMPQGLENLMTVSELRHLVAFLASTE